MTRPLAWSHRAAEIPEAGLQVRREATPAERAAIGEALDIVACEALSADYCVRPLGEGRYRMTGTLAGRVIQACVVTLEPVPQALAEEFDVAFWPADGMPRASEEEVEVLSAAEIEPIEHGQIDAGRVLFEVLSASLNPYPRKAGARFEWEDQAGESAPEARGPFADLERLKKGS